MFFYSHKMYLISTYLASHSYFIIIFLNIKYFRDKKINFYSLAWRAMTLLAIKLFLCKLVRKSDFITD